MARILNTILLLACVSTVVLFTVFRFQHLSTSPPGFFVDESSIGYDAWHVLQTGRDEHQVRLPLYFESFGEYKNPIFIYSVIPSIYFEGLSVESVRLTAAWWGTAAIGVFVFLSLRVLKSKNEQILAVLVIVSSPWLVVLTRTAFEVAALPFFLILSILAVFVLTERKSLSFRQEQLWAVTLGSGLGIFFYSYTAARLLTPLLLASAVFAIWKVRGWKPAVTTTCVAAVCAVPLVFSEVVRSGALFARYSVVGLSHYTSSTGEFVHRFASQYLNHFSLEYLIGGGDHNLRHAADPYGIFLTSTLLFVLAGLFVLLFEEKTVFGKWLLFGVVVSPLASAVTIQSPHVLRAVYLSVFLTVVSLFGIELVWKASAKQTLVWFLVVGAVLIDAVRFLFFMNNSYPERAGIWYDADTVTAVKELVELPPPYFISDQLYPGTTVTVSFFAAAVGRSVTATESVGTVANFSPNMPGSYLLDAATCQKLPLLVSPRVQFHLQTPGHCIVSVK